MSARDLDPAVWAAAYGTTYATQAEAVRLAGAEGNAFGINVERCRQVADDAVLSLHPEGPPLPLPERAPETPAARLDAAERAYLLGAGWKPVDGGGWSHRDYRETLITSDATLCQRCDDRRTRAG